MTFTIEFEITINKLQSLYQHLNHTDAIKYLEEARTQFISSIGFPLEMLVQRGHLLVVTGIQVKFLRELRAEKITVTCENPSHSDKSITLDQRIINQKGKDAVKAVVELACISAQIKRAIVPPEDFLEAFLLKI